MNVASAVFANKAFGKSKSAGYLSTKNMSLISHAMSTVVVKNNK